MEKDEIIRICESMRFALDYDQSEEKGWIRFVLPNNLDEKDLRLIWYMGDPLADNLRRAGSILFIAGQKAKIQQLNEYVKLR